MDLGPEIHLNSDYFALRNVRSEQNSLNQQHEE